MLSVVPFNDPEQSHSNNNSFDVPVAVAVPLRSNFMDVAWANVADVLPEEEWEVLTDRQRRLFRIYKLSRIMRLCALVETMFILVFGCITPLFFIILPFPLLGYFGSKYWISRFMYVYIVYIVIEFITGIISIYVLRHVVLLLILRAVYVFINVFILYYAVRLTTFMLALEETDFHFLKTSDIIRSLERNQLC